MDSSTVCFSTSDTGTVSASSQSNSVISTCKRKERSEDIDRHCIADDVQIATKSRYSSSKAALRCAYIELTPEIIEIHRKRLCIKD
jgi:hypothetical protein